MPGPCPDDEAGVFHLFDVDHRVDQPGVAAAQPDDPPICLLDFGVGVGEKPPLLRQLRPDGVVAAGALFFNCLKAELVAVVDAGNPWQEPSSATACGQCRESLIWLATRVTSWLPRRSGG